ncbi:apolipoprotein C-II isoform X1 [Carassius auratus]|uniref:Apolipoprotein C-II n=2 Tax=Carassius auratus TaxID=7957 RepID=A0A6P6R4V9_CARAU|nr:apolipoprotein C-II-like isoform X1 [Carassius auratus]
MSIHVKSHIFLTGQGVLPLTCLTHFLQRRNSIPVIMNKLLVITAVIAFLALGAESFRVPRQAEEERGTISTVVDTLKSYYDQSVDTASGYVETIKGYKLNEKAKNLYDDTVRAVSTYAGISYDQLYHMLYPQES